jgi:hypothetical protein
LFFTKNLIQSQSKKKTLFTTPELLMFAKKKQIFPSSFAHTPRQMYRLLRISDGRNFLTIAVLVYGRGGFDYGIFLALPVLYEGGFSLSGAGVLSSAG